MIFSLFCSVSFAQALKLKAYKFTYKTKYDDGQWSDWAEWEDVNILITVENDRIKIYSKNTQTYDIIKTYDDSYDKVGDKTSEWRCVNEDGLECNIRFMKRYSQDDTNQLYVDFSNLTWVYNIYKLD